MRKLAERAPCRTVGQKEGAKIGTQQMCYHRHLRAVGVEGAAFAAKIVGYLFGRDDHVGVAGDVDAEDGAVDVSPGFELEPGVVLGDLGEVADERVACSGALGLDGSVGVVRSTFWTWQLFEAFERGGSPSGCEAVQEEQCKRGKDNYTQ